MVNYARWNIILTVVICALGLVYAAPNFFARGDEPSGLPAWLPHQQVNLGLDLQGGSHLLLEVDIDSVIREDLEATVSEVRRVLRRERIGYTGLGVAAGAVGFTLRDIADIERARALVREVNPGLSLTVRDDGTFRLELTEEAREDRRLSALEQSIEIVRRRVDETGTAEPTIQRQGRDRILVQLPGLRDPERIKRLLGKTARLTFHLVDSSVSPADAAAGRVPAGSIVLPEQETGRNYAVRREVVVGGDRLTNAQPQVQDGQPVVSFTFDAAGGRRFGEATSQNVGEQLAIVLDNEVVSAPVIRTAILGGSGIITGRFTIQEVQDLSLLLRAGALPAPLTILEERTVGPGLGADSIAAGKIASIVGLILVLVFMVVAYGLFGIMADVALLLNIAMIFGVLSVLQATLTLPGIAGIVLTIGMAVDANVLIFERIREELRSGRTPISAIDAGYRRALTTIIDSNLTTLIAAVILLSFGSGPVRGFAVTLSIGIVSSMFTAIMVTRLMVVVWLRQRRPQVVPI
ncbi:MAG: protein translocase subunit SecD [Alphaproteobacteria bacterium]